MILPPKLWIVVGDLALGSHRKRRKANPIRPLTDAECGASAGPVLGRPFLPDQSRVEHYQKAVAIAARMRMGPTPSLEDSKMVMQDERIAVDTKAYVIFRRSLAHCEALFRELTPLLGRPDWQFPANKGADNDYPELKAFKRLNFAMQARARCQWLELDQRAALESILAATHFTNRMQRCSGLFIHFLVGQSCKALLIRMIRMTALSHPLNDRFLVELQAIVHGIGTRVTSWRNIIEDELCFTVVPNAQLRGLPWESKRESSADVDIRDAFVLQQILVEWVIRDHPNPLDRVATIELVRRLYEDLLPEFEEPLKLYERLANMANDLGGGYPSWFSQALYGARTALSRAKVEELSQSLSNRPNPLGTLYVSRICWHAAQMVLADLRTKAEANAILVCLAAIRHRLAVGEPQMYRSLQELVDAGFLGSIPTDPLWGGEVGFDTDTQVVWYPGPKAFDFEKALKAKGSGDGWVWPLNRITV